MTLFMYVFVSSPILQMRKLPGLPVVCLYALNYRKKKLLLLYDLTIVLSMSLLSINIIIITIILEYRRDVFQNSRVVYVIQFMTRYIFLVILIDT